MTDTLVSLAFVLGASIPLVVALWLEARERRFARRQLVFLRQALADCQAARDRAIKGRWQAEEERKAETAALHRQGANFRDYRLEMETFRSDVTRSLGALKLPAPDFLDGGAVADSAKHSILSQI